MDIEEFFTLIISQARSIDIAEAEFKRQLSDNEALRHEYSEWCTAQGFTERNGFREFCEEFLDSQRDIFDSLTDYDEQY